ncbi:MAG TPA: hypothetical protein VEI03_24240 [Stellaceae bacterium]|nr:hypothetical protein [Stellaceae bacterium]
MGSEEINRSSLDAAPRSLSLPATAVIFVLLVAVLCVAFMLNANFLLFGLDGMDWTITFATQALDKVPFTQEGVDPLQGSFDAYVPVFREYLLPDALALIFSHAPASRVVIYANYGAFLLLAAYQCARRTGFDRPAALLGGFMLPVVSLPVFFNHTSQFYPLFSLNPHISQIVAMSLLIVAAFWAIDGRSPARSIALIFVPALCVVLSILGNAGGFVLLVPATAIYGGASLFLRQDRRDRAMRVVAIALAIVVPAALGMITYYRGLVGYTAYNFFSDEFEQTRASLFSASTLYWLSPFGKYAIAGGLLGAAGIALMQRGGLRLFALTHLAATLGVLTAATAVVTYADWYKGPSPVYFEIAFWPYSLFFGAAVVLAVGGAILRLLARIARVRAVVAIARQSAATILVIVAGIVLVYDVAGALRSPQRQISKNQFFPIRPTAITDYLAKTTALKPGAPFKGLVATVDGIDGNSSIDWFVLHDRDAELWQKTGNDHRIVGLKYFGIPTLFDYSTYMTPPYYLLLSDFLSRPADRQVRSIVLLSRLDAPIMQLWGVRYVIVDSDSGIGTTVATVAVPGGPALLLKELLDPNLGDYSPTEAIQVPDYRSGLRILHGSGFDGRTRVVTDSTLDGPFVAASSVQLVFERDGFHISAQSRSRSLLVLPAQYSHCWSVQGSGEPHLFRADLMQLGVSFSGALDAELVFRYGPLFAGQCRVDDANDMIRLRIGEAREYDAADAGKP